MKILLLGDVHAAFTRFGTVVIKAMDYGVDAVIQVGDFGFWHQYLKDVVFDFPIPIYVIDGNHENHEWLYKQPHEEWSKKNFNFMKRGSILEMGSSIVGFVGGAMHADRKQEGSIDKRTTNYLLNVEEKEIAQKFNSLYQPLDLLVTHSCPHSIGVGMTGHPALIPLINEFVIDRMGVSVGSIRDCGEEVLKQLWEDLDHKPKNWAFGHFHSRVMREVGNTTFVCCGCTDSSDGVPYIIPFIYDTETKQIDYEPDIKL